MFPARAPGKKPDYGTNNTVELLEKIPSQIVDLKLDEVLSAVMEVDNLCDYARCKAKTKLIGETCAFCNKRFCFKHNLPEVHGCGEAIKTHQRKLFEQAKPAKAVQKETDLVQAKKRLQEKIQSKRDERTSKSSNVPSSSSKGKKKKAK